MLIQKMERQPTDPTSSPPTTGPRAMLTPMTAPHTPMACARSRGSVNVLVMIDMATGLSIDPPMACTMRKITSVVRFGARLHSSDPATKVEEADHERPAPARRSAVEPESMRRLARTRV